MVEGEETVRLEYSQPPGASATLDLVSDAAGHVGPGQPVPLTTGELSDTVPCRPSRLRSVIVGVLVPPTSSVIRLGVV